MTSIFNFKKNTWRNLKIAVLGEEPQINWRFGASVFPIFDTSMDAVNRILILGGVDLMSPNAFS